MKIPHHLRKLRRRLGFTLPEVAIAVAIATVGLTSTLGLMPKGIETLKRANDAATQARIVQQILSTLNLAQWQDTSGNDLLTSNYNGQHLYYDDLAVQISPAAPGSNAVAPANAAYVAELLIPPADISLPQAASSAPTPDAYLRRVLIKIGAGNASDATLAAANPVNVAQYSSVIARSGQ